MSPELLDPERSGFGDGRPTKESDCYALGMVVYEVLSGQVPFAQDKNTIVIQKVMEGGRPGRPRRMEGEWFTDGLWGTLERCWKPQPYDRPSLKTLLQRLEGMSPPSRAPSPAPTASEDTVPDVGASSDPTVTKLGMFSTLFKASDVKRLKTRGRNPNQRLLSNLDHKVALSAPHIFLSPPTSGKSSLAEPIYLYSPHSRCFRQV